MPQSPDPKIVREWALRLGKDRSHIRRLIKSGKLENRYPRPNEGPPVPPALKGKVPVARNYVEIRVGQRNKLSEKSLVGRLDKVLGREGSERERIWQRVFAIFDDPELTSNQAEAASAGFEVMAAWAKKPSQLHEILAAALERCRRRINQQAKESGKKPHARASPPLKRSFPARSRSFAADRITGLSESDLRRVQTFAKVMQKAMDNANRDPKAEKWTQGRIAQELGLSTSGYRKFLQRVGLGHASRAAQLNQTRTFRSAYTDYSDLYVDEDAGNYNTPS